MEINVFKELLAINKSGVYALFNHIDKRVLVCYSKNMAESLVRTLKKIHNNTHNSHQLMTDKLKLEFKVLEQSQKTQIPINLKLANKKWCKQLVTEGYKLYVDYIHPKLKLEFQILPETNQKYKVRVVIVTSRYNRIVLGEFPNMPEAREWAVGNYGTFKEVEKVVRKSNAIRHKKVN